MRSRHAGEVAERRVALEHVLPLAPDLRDLDEVVHHPQAREAGLLGGARDVGQRRPRSSPGCPGQSKRESCRPKSSVIGSSCWRAAACGAVRNGGRHERRPGPARARRRSPRPRARRRRRAAASRSWAVTTLAGTGSARARLRRRTSRGGRVERRRRGPARRGARPARATRPGAPRRAPSSRPPSSAGARSRLADDQVEHLEGVAAGALVALARADDRAQPVRGDDLVGVEPRGRPVRLARARSAPTSTTRHGSGRRSGGPSSVASAAAAGSGGAVGADEGGSRSGAATAPGGRGAVAAELALERAARRRARRRRATARRRPGRRSAAPPARSRRARSPPASR